MKTIQLFIVLLISQFSIAQTKENYDLLSYTAPKGWEKQTTEKAIQFSIEDVSKGTYCLITLYKAIPGKSNAKENFDLAWESLIKESLSVSTPPEMQPASTENGWEAQSGYALFETDGNKGLALLVTSSGFEKMVNIVVLTNSDIYQKKLDAFLESVSLKKPTGITKQANNKETNTVKPQVATIATKKDGFTFTTSNFDDGWVANIEADWVSVKKNNVTVYLLYALPYNSNNFSGTGVMERDYYWDNYVTKYFNVQSKMYRDAGEFVAAFKPKYVEGSATNKQTGQKIYIAMTLEIAPNTAYITVASAPNEKTLLTQFPKANDRYSSDITAMNRYNKFAIASKDIPGKWQNGNTSTAQWYYTSPTGYEGYAGMTLASSSATFNFNNNGTYSSIQNGATGAIGNMNTFQQEYKGAYTVTNWNITATNRYGGKTDKFDASFTAVRGGRILKLNNNAGQIYNLVKVK